MKEKEPEAIREAVRQHYRAVASQGSSCCGPISNCGCSAADASDYVRMSLQIGYSAEELGQAPASANFGLGCGNPQAIAALKPGESVLDLGSGPGLDSFLAARQVGAEGFVIGVDMLPEMVSQARASARAEGYANVSFRLGEMEAMPVADGVVDVIMSNCAINLSPDKAAVFREAFRVLKPGGRLAVSDVVATAELPLEMRLNLDLYAGCAAGALTIRELELLLADAGFVQIEIKPRDESRTFIREWAPGHNIEEYIVSAAITAAKPL